MANSLDLIDQAISDLEARLSLAPGANPGGSNKKAGDGGNKKKKEGGGGGGDNKKTKGGGGGGGGKKGGEPNLDQPEICKLEFKVGVITKVWEHPEADKLYCEEIDIGEETGPRQIASGLRPHFSLVRPVEVLFAKIIGLFLNREHTKSLTNRLYHSFSPQIPCRMK